MVSAAQRGSFRPRQLDGPLWPRKCFGFIVGDLSFDMSTPEQARGFIRIRGYARPGGGGVELIGEHRSPFRDPPLVRARFDKKSPLPLREGLAPIRIFGEYQVADTSIFPACRDTGPPLRRVFVFLGFVLRISALIRANRQSRLFGNSRQRGSALQEPVRDAADLSQTRRDHSWPRLLQLPRPRVEKELKDRIANLGKPAADGDAAISRLSICHWVGCTWSQNRYEFGVEQSLPEVALVKLPVQSGW